MVLAKVAYNQQATYFPAPVEDSFGGMTFGEPELLNVKWYEKLEVFVDSQGNERRSFALVYVLKPLEVNGYLVKGDHTDKDSPIGIEGAYFIKRQDITPDLRGLNEEIKVYL